MSILKDIISQEGFPFKFPGGEVQVRVNGKEAFKQVVVTISKKVRCSDDIMELLLTVDALRRSGSKQLKLVLPYVPYAQQDRVMVPGEALSIKVFADLLNSCKFEEVEIWDPHSDVAVALIDNARVVPQEELVKWAFTGESSKRITNSKQEAWLKNCILVCPDAGARKKILKVAGRFGTEKIVYADKVRDVSTGEITGTSVNTDLVTIIEDSKFVIVDDICVGGRTFIEIAMKMRSTLGIQKEDMYLYITHGIFPNGLDELAKYFDGIYVTNLMNESVREHPLLKGVYS